MCIIRFLNDKIILNVGGDLDFNVRNTTTIQNGSFQWLPDLNIEFTELTKKLNFAYRTTNAPLIQQLNMAIESYRNQQKKKMDEIFEKQKIDNKINIQSVLLVDNLKGYVVVEALDPSQAFDGPAWDS